MTEKQLREEAIESIRSKVCGERLKEYGSVESNFGRIAALWNVWLSKKNVTLGPEDVAAMMILMKMARLMENPFHLDSSIDAGGYAVCLSVLAKNAAGKEHNRRADHGDEELKSPIAQNPMESIYGPVVLRCQNKDGHGNQCCLSDGHTSDHDFSLERVYRP